MLHEHLTKIIYYKNRRVKLVENQRDDLRYIIKKFQLLEHGNQNTNTNSQRTIDKKLQAILELIDKFDNETNNNIHFPTLVCKREILSNHVSYSNLLPCFRESILNEERQRMKSDIYNIDRIMQMAFIGIINQTFSKRQYKFLMKTV